MLIGGKEEKAGSWFCLREVPAEATGKLQAALQEDQPRTTNHEAPDGVPAGEDQETEILQDVGRCRNRGHPGLVQTLIPGPAVTNPPPINAPPQVWVMTSNLCTFYEKIWGENQVEWLNTVGDGRA